MLSAPRPQELSSFLIPLTSVIDGAHGLVSSITGAIVAGVVGTGAAMAFTRCWGLF